MNIILSIICFFLFLPVCMGVSQHQDEKNRIEKKRRDDERMLRQTMEQSLKNKGGW